MRLLIRAAKPHRHPCDDGAIVNPAGFARKAGAREQAIGPFIGSRAGYGAGKES